jgi:hypothetical protein
MSANRMPGVTGNNTSNISGPSGMDVINNNSTSTGKVGDSQKTGTPPAKMDAPAAGKGGGSPAEIMKFVSDAISKISETAIAAINKAMPGGGKDAAASKGDAASKAGDDPAKTDEATGDKSESSKFELAKEAISKIFDTVMAVLGKSPAEGKGDVASAKGKDAEGSDAGGKDAAKASDAGSKKDAGVGTAGKDDLAKTAETAINKIKTAASKNSEPAAAKKSESAADKQPMGVFEADVAKTAMNAIRDVANKPSNATQVA